MERHDLEAIRFALTMARKDPELGSAIEAMLKTRSELEAGLSAAYACQCRALHLRPWEACPCETIDTPNPRDVFGHRASEVALLRRMLRAGVSRFHPDPMQALAAIERAA